MTKRLAILIIATALGATMLAAGVAIASSGASSAKPKVVQIVMADPGCHWFKVAGKNKLSLTVTGATTFRNFDEAAVIFKGKNYLKRVPVGKTLTVTKRGTYHITMVKQASDDNHLLLVVK